MFVNADVLCVVSPFVEIFNGNSYIISEAAVFMVKAVVLLTADATVVVLVGVLEFIGKEVEEISVKVLVPMFDEVVKVR